MQQTLACLPGFAAGVAKVLPAGGGQQVLDIVSPSATPQSFVLTAVNGANELDRVDDGELSVNGVVLLDSADFSQRDWSSVTVVLQPGVNQIVIDSGTTVGGSLSWVMSEVALF